MDNSSPHSKLSKALDRIPDERIADVLLEALSAKTTNRAGVREPDTRVRVQAATLILSYKIGRPNVSTGPVPQETDKSESLVEMLIRSPYVMAQIESALQAAKAKAAASD